VNASFQQTLWTMMPISAGAIRLKNAGYVFGGEVLRLFLADQCFTLPQPGVSEHPYNVFYEAGSVGSHARSLWRLEFIRTRWYGGFMTHGTPVRLRHITSGRYLGVCNGSNDVAVVHRDKASADVITFLLTASKDERARAATEAQEPQEECMGAPLLKYGDTLVYMQHAKTGWWLSYQACDGHLVGRKSVQRLAVVNYEINTRISITRRTRRRSVAWERSRRSGLLCTPRATWTTASRSCAPRRKRLALLSSSANA
jgi:hypothetical protein